MSAIPPRRRVVLDFIKSYLRDNGYPPTLREIAAHLGVSGAQGVVDHLKALEATGYIRRSKFASRAITVLDREVQS